MADTDMPVLPADRKFWLGQEPGWLLSDATSTIIDLQVAGCFAEGQQAYRSFVVHWCTTLVLDENDTPGLTHVMTAGMVLDTRRMCPTDLPSRYDLAVSVSFKLWQKHGTARWATPEARYIDAMRLVDWFLACDLGR